MATITRFAPIPDVALLQNRLNTIFSEFGRPAPGDNETLGSHAFIPLADVYEDAHKVSLRMEIPASGLRTSTSA